MIIIRYTFIIITFFITILHLSGCESAFQSIVEVSEGYRISKNTNLTVVLETPLSSNTNQRGDQFVARIKKPLLLKGKSVLSKETEIRGLVKRATKHVKFGDRAGLLLIFDQLVLPGGQSIPISSSLDTEKGYEVIKIKGKALKNTKVIGGSAVVGALVGDRVLKEKGAEKGLLIGAAAGTTAVILANMKEINLPVGTELIIKLEESVIIPKHE